MHLLTIKISVTEEMKDWKGFVLFHDIFLRETKPKICFVINDGVRREQYLSPRNETGNEICQVDAGHRSSENSSGKCAVPQRSRNIWPGCSLLQGNHGKAPAGDI